MKDFLTYHEYIFESQLLTEIGDASSKQFKYTGPSPKAVLNDLNKEIKKLGGYPYEWSDEKTVEWKFQGNEGPAKRRELYTCKITWMVRWKASTISLTPKKTSEKRKKEIRANISFYVSGKDRERTTNLGEQYQVLSTVTEITVNFIKGIIDEYRLDNIWIIPKADEGEEVSPNNRRGKFYEAYLRKQINKIKRPLTVSIGQDGGFVILDGHWSSQSNPNSLIKNESLTEKKTEDSPDKWHHSDAPDANGKFAELEPKELASWLIKTRKGDAAKIQASLTQQIVFRRNEDPEYAEKMEKTRDEVRKQLQKDEGYVIEVKNEDRKKKDKVVGHTRKRGYYKDDPPDIGLYSKGGRDAIKGTGYSDKEKAEFTVKELDKLMKQDERVWAMSIATTMESRAKKHPHQTQGMRDAMKIFREWIDKNKKS